MVLDMGDAELDEDGVCGMLLQAFPEAPQQMAGVALLAPRIFPKEKHPAKKVSFARSVAEQDSGSRRMTLDNWKLYLNTCDTYHSAFVDWMLSNVHQVNTILRGNCNAGGHVHQREGYLRPVGILAEHEGNREPPFCSPERKRWLRSRLQHQS